MTETIRIADKTYKIAHNAIASLLFTPQGNTYGQ